MVFLNMTSDFISIILAAGAGTRMRSELPKMLHKVANKSMINHILDQVTSLQPKQTYIVYGYKGDVLREAIENDYDNLTWAYQDKQLGTAHAVKVATDLIQPSDIPVFVAFSDNPLITKASIQRLLDKFNEGYDIVLMSTVLDNAFGYGRVIRDKQDNVLGIVEERDATEQQKQVKEVFPGIFVTRLSNLQKLLSQVNNDNAQNEYYLTDIVRLAYQQRQRITTLPVDNKEVASANTKFQLAQLEDNFQERQIRELTEAGLILKSANPSSFQLRGELEFGADCEVDINCIFNGKVKLGNHVCIGAGCILTDCEIGDNVVIEPYSIIEKSQVHANATIGPFARLRPNSIIAEKAKVGNFVETKNVQLGKGSKANHLTYLGDAQIGSGVNIGAGVITCNYDGANKSKTIIGDDAFIGSDVQLVAPVAVAPGATVGAGTTVTKDVEAKLVYNKKEMVVRDDYVRPTKKK